jgi:arabinose-5-phosphate isomerase
MYYSKMNFIINYVFDNIRCVSSDIDISEIAKIICESNVENIYVFDDSNNIVGLINQETILTAIANGKNIYKMKAKDLMITDFLKIDKNMSLDECYDVFCKTRYQTIPVLDKDKNMIIGVVNKNMIYKEYNKSKILEIYDLQNRIKTVK